MLNNRLTSYLNYFERRATQPPNHWEGFYLTRREEMHFGLRFQIAFPCYALAAICLHPDAAPPEQERCRKAMAALIERMLQRRVWAYWAGPAEDRGTIPDPVSEANCHYSGLLAMMIGAFERAGGDRRFDEPFTLFWRSDARFVYTHTTLVEALWRQMRASDHGGVACEPGRIRPPCMAHALWANTLHDQLHGSDYARANARWLAFLQDRLVFGGPRLPGRGVFSSVYLSRMRRRAPFGFNLTDAWTLALLASLESDLVQRLAPRFLGRIRRNNGPLPDAGNDQVADDDGMQAYTPSAALWRRIEVADPTLTTGFSYLLAVALGDTALAAALLAYADTSYGVINEGGERYYTGGLAALTTTALFALGEAGGLSALQRTLLDDPQPEAAAMVEHTVATAIPTDLDLADSV